MPGWRDYRLGELDGMGVEAKSRDEIYRATGLKIPVGYSWAEVIHLLVAELLTAREAGKENEY